MATTSGSALTLCTGPSGRGCCQTTFSGTRRGNATDPLTQWLGAAAGAGCARVPPVSLGGFWKNFLFYAACVVALFALGKAGLCLRPSILQSFWCMGVACGVRRIWDACAAWFDSGYMFYVRLWTNFTYFLRCGELESCGVCSPFLQNGEACTVHAAGCSFSQRGLHVGTWTRRFFAAQCSWSPR